jgi:hypothetical protein
MKLFWLAAGFATGYVLGTRAGRERYEQMAETARELSKKPQVAQMQAKMKDLADRSRDRVAARTGPRPGDTVVPNSNA